MKRTTIFLDSKLERALKRLAARRGVSFAMVVREAMAAYVATPEAGTVPSIAGRFTSGKGDTSEQVDDLLWRDPHA
jgi:predicted transcriptional regulator